MTLKNKLLACLAALGVAFLLIIGAFYNSSTDSKAALETVLNDRVAPLDELKKVADGYAVAIVDTAHKVRAGSMGAGEGAEAVERGETRLHAAWKAYRATSIEGEEARLADTAEQRMRAADDDIARLRQIMRQNDRAALDQFVTGELYPVIDPISESVNALVDLQVKVATAETSEALSRAGTALKIMLVLALIAIAVLGTSGFIVTRKVVRPIKELAAIIAGLARQSGSTQLPHLEQKDEIGDISRSVDAYLSSIVEKERENAAAAAAVQHLVTSSLATGLSNMAQGDLSHEVTAQFPAEYDSLKTNFNEAVAALRELIGKVSESTREIRTGSGEIAQASEDLARRTESNAASLEETSAAVAQIDGRIKATAEAAGRTVDRADQAIATVSGGRAVAEEAVQAMGRVSDSAKGIDDVIEGLDKIAFQTRVLAMNAAVEAGRAGDAGKGFAVVADLVSALAMRAEEEAKRARDQLTVTQTDIVCAVEAVQKVDGALADISGDVGEVHQLLATMAQDNQAQSTAITQISAAIGSMDQATQQNAAMVEETSAAARNLSTEVDALADQAALFKTGNEGGARKTKAKAVTPKHFVPAAPRAPAPAAVADGDWTEF